MFIQEIITYKVYINDHSKRMGNDLFDIHDDYPLESFEFPYYDADFLLNDVMYRKSSRQRFNNIEYGDGKELISAIKKQYEVTINRDIEIDFNSDYLTIESILINKFYPLENPPLLSRKLIMDFDNGFNCKQYELKYVAHYISYYLWTMKNTYEKKEYLKNIVKALAYYADKGKVSYRYKEEQSLLSEDTIQQLVDNYFKNKRIDTFLRATYKVIVKKESTPADLRNEIHSWSYSSTFYEEFMNRLNSIKRIFKMTGSGYDSENKVTTGAVCLLLYYTFINKETVSFNTFKNTIVAYWGFDPITYKENQVKDCAFLLYEFSLNCDGNGDQPINDKGYWKNLTEEEQLCLERSLEKDYYTNRYDIEGFLGDHRYSKNIPLPKLVRKMERDYKRDRSKPMKQTVSY